MQIGIQIGVRRLPHGRRGLKSDNNESITNIGGRLPHGRRGLKYVSGMPVRCHNQGRLPHGRRGLKFLSSVYSYHLLHVASRMGGGD